MHYSLPVAVSNPDLTAIRDRLEEKVSEEAERLRVPGVAVGVWASGFVVAALLGAHAYRGTHTGFVLSACGPGVEIIGSPRAFMEQCR